MERVRASIERVAPTDFPVLLTGETGTGKSTAARSIHDGSRRAGAPFITLECRALPRTHVEAALFGHEPGVPEAEGLPQAGAFEQANGGTLFLDELAELPTEVQPKIVTAIAKKEIVRLGGETPIPVDVRIIAATNRDIDRMVDEGKFRGDLYFRLSSISIRLPSVRARPEDLVELIEYFFKANAAELAQAGAKGKRVGREAMTRLLAHPYFGNVRELENVLRHSALFAQDEEIQPADLPPQLREEPKERQLEGLSALGLSDAKARLLDAFERAYLADLLVRHGNRVSVAAREAGIGDRHLRRLMRKHGLRRSR